MRHLKKILLLIIILSTTILITGCGNRKTITVERFTSYMKDNGFETTDIIENLGYEVTGVTSSIFASNEREESVITYMVFNSEEIAQKYFDQTISDYDSDAEQRYDVDTDKVEVKRISDGNYKKYILSTVYGQNTVALIGNTVMQGETTGNKRLLTKHFDELKY